MIVFLMQMKDTCAEGDGERNDINIKRLLQYFKSHSSFTKYAIEMFTAIAQRKALLSEEMAHRIRWGRFVNWVGGKGKNIECDTAQEICNRVCKNIVLGMGANKTSAVIIRASKSAAGVEKILIKFDCETGHNQTPHLNNAMNTKILGEITDEVVPWEVNQQCNLMNAIFSQAVNLQVQKLRKKMLRV